MKISAAMVLFIGVTLFSSFIKPPANIARCFISFKKTDDLKMASITALTPAQKIKALETAKGNTEVLVEDGYSIVYNTREKEPFLRLEVEALHSESYSRDTTAILNNLMDINGKNADMEAPDLITLNYNGYKIYGISHRSIGSTDSTFATFVMFPGNNVAVFFHINNLLPLASTIKNLNDYKGKRNAFMGEYTGFIKSTSSNK